MPGPVNGPGFGATTRRTAATARSGRPASGPASVRRLRAATSPGRMPARPDLAHPPGVSPNRCPDCECVPFHPLILRAHQFVSAPPGRTPPRPSYAWSVTDPRRRAAERRPRPRPALGAARTLLVRCAREAVGRGPRHERRRRRARRPRRRGPRRPAAGRRARHRQLRPGDQRHWGAPPHQPRAGPGRRRRPRRHGVRRWRLLEPRVPPGDRAAGVPPRPRRAPAGPGVRRRGRAGREQQRRRRAALARRAGPGPRHTRPAGPRCPVSRRYSRFE